MPAISDLLEKYDRLSPRERVLIVLAMTAICFFLLDALLLTPQQRQLKQTEMTLQLQQTELATLTKALAQQGAQASATAKADKAQQAEMAALQQQIDAFERLIGPAGTGQGNIGTAAQQLLLEHSGVALIRLKTLPTSPFSAAGSGYPALQRLGLELGLRGSYPALMAYLKDLERHAGTVYWTEAKLESRYPDAVLNLVVNRLRRDGEPNR